MRCRCAPFSSVSALFELSLSSVSEPFEMQCKAADNPGDCHWCPMPVGHGGKSYCEVNATVCRRGHAAAAPPDAEVEAARLEGEIAALQAQLARVRRGGGR